MKCTLDIKQMKKLAEQLASRVLCFPEGGKVIILKGEVGAGKTTFSRFFSEYLNIEASSPTFSIIEARSSENFVNEKQKLHIIHADFYRAGPERTAELLDEYLDKYPLDNKNNIYLLEWVSDEMKHEFFYDENISTIEIEFFHDFSQSNEEFGNTRTLEICFKNPHSISVQNAYKIQKKFMTPLHVQHHIEMVRRIAVFCAKRLKDNNIPIDVELVEASAILHDAVRYVDFPKLPENTEDAQQIQFYLPQENITNEKCEFWKKIKERYKKVHHAYAMQDILQKMNFEATGQVVKSHYTGDIFRAEEFSLEEICVYYADKRGLHTTFVTIKERLSDGLKRYPNEQNARNQQKLLGKILSFEQMLQNLGNWNEEDIQKAMIL